MVEVLVLQGLGRQLNLPNAPFIHATQFVRVGFVPVRKGADQVDAGRVGRPFAKHPSVLLPVEASQKPMYEILKKVHPDSRYEVYPGGHGEFSLFYEQIRADVLNWLDQRLGPVE